MKPNPQIELCDKAQEVMWMTAVASVLPESEELVVAVKRADEALQACQGCSDSRLIKDGAHLCALADGDISSQLRALGADAETPKD